MLRFCVPLVVLIGFTHLFAIQTVQSTINAVTVFSDRALVTRTASLTLSAGEQTLVFDQLPESVDPASFQVNGTGPIELRDVVYRRQQLEQIADTDIRRLHERRVALEDSIFLCDERVKRSRDEKTFVDNITKKLTDTAEKATTIELDPAKWAQMVEFYRKKLVELDSDVRSADLLRRAVRQRLDKTKREIADLESRGSKQRNQAEVKLAVRAPGKATISLTYLVYGPSWEPLYDLRVLTEKDTMNVTYNALITQNTGEIWEGVALSLSTAQVSLGGTQPELSPWYIEIARPLPPPVAYRSAPAMQKSRSVSLAANAPMQEDKMELLMSETQMEVRSAAVSTNATSVQFAIAGKSSIASDNQQHRVSIGRFDLKAQLSYASVPKLAPYAYLTALVTNASDYVLLPGRTAIFLDNAFVANAHLNAVAPGEEFTTSLGIDEGISVKQKLVKSYIKDKGTFTKRTTKLFEYQLVVKNNKKSAQKLVLRDQIPISGNQEITVRLLQPPYDKETTELSLNEHKYLVWRLNLEPGKEITIPFEFSVEYPADAVISGL